MLWLDGTVRSATRAEFDFRDRGLLLADGVFETILVVGAVPFRLNAHLARMKDSAAVLRLPVDAAAARQAVLDLAGQLDGAGVVRVTATRGPGTRGLAMPAEPDPLLFATAVPWSPALAFGEQRLGLSVIRRNESSPLCRIKSLTYLDNVLAHDAALASGHDDALMLSSGGKVACTSMANLFVVQGRDLLTPPITDGVLPGILRALILGLAPGCGLRAMERSLDLDDVTAADAVFSTNSVRLVTRVAELDGRPIGRDGEALDGLVVAVREAIEHECGASLPRS